MKGGPGFAIFRIAMTSSGIGAHQRLDMIRVKDLFKRFGAFEALKYISFEVAAGDSVGLLGENGAGKTTTMRILSCFLPPTSGIVEVGGKQVVLESAEVRRMIGYMPESVPVYGNMRVEEFIRFRGRLRGLGGAELKTAVDKALDRVDLLGRRRSLVQTLSKGLRQRVGLADALVHEPALLILDEPTSGLDPSQRREVRDLIKSLEGEHTVLVSSHILPEIESTCSRVIVMNEGKVVSQSSIEDLKKFGDRDHFVVEFRGDAERAQAALLELIDITLGQVETEDGLVRFHCSSPDRKEARARLVAALMNADCSLRELRGADHTLEDAFLELIGKSEAS